MIYTFQIITSKYLGNGVGFCYQYPRESNDLKLTLSCGNPSKHPIQASSVIIGQWLKRINECDNKDMVYLSHCISRALYESNNKCNSVEHKVLIYKNDGGTFISDVDATMKIVDNCYDIDSAKIKSIAWLNGNTLRFNNKSSWLYNIITTYKL